mgnify:CR=1 FL=1
MRISLYFSYESALIITKESQTRLKYHDRILNLSTLRYPLESLLISNLGYKPTNKHTFKLSVTINPNNTTSNGVYMVNFSHIRRSATATLIIGSCTAQFAFAGAWVPGEGEGYSKIGVSTYEADESFGSGSTGSKFEGQNTSYYGEYGLGSDLAVFGTLLYQDLKQTDEFGTSTTSKGFGDTEIGVRYQWFSDSYVLSSSLLFKTPALYDKHDDLPRGNGQEDYEFKMLLGKSLNNYGYFGAELGYRLRTDEPSDEIRYLLEYGISASDNLYFRTKLDGIHSVENADKLTTSASNSSLNLSATPEYDLGKLELTAGWQFGKPQSDSQVRWGVEFTYNQDLYGSNTLKGDGMQVGITAVF